MPDRPDLDERFVIEGDPEDALRSLMQAERPLVWDVEMTDATGKTDHVLNRRVRAVDEEGARAIVRDIWAKEFGEPVENDRAVIQPVE
jgi:hypothetical protein